MTNKQKNLLFWILNTGGWALYAFVYFFLFRKVGENDTLTTKLLFLLTYLVGFAITIILRYIYRLIRKKVRQIGWNITLVLVILLLFCFLWYGIDIGISLLFWDPKAVQKFIQNVGFMYFFRMTVMNFIPLLAWSTLYFSITWWLEWQYEKRRAEEAIHLARKSQFEMLRYQLNPHFLFNSLNSARALIDEDPRSAREMITELSEFLRYSLVDKDIAFRPLRDELRALQHYLSIEKKRFEEKLQINYEVDPLTAERPILGFLIHPLIENAIKYGMKTSESPLKLLIRTSLDKDYLVIRICNSGRWIEEDQHDGTTGKGTGTGLVNVQKRLENAYPGRHYFRIEKSPDQVCIIIGINESDGES
ncbi:MAG: histidine kinase [bacterium]